MVHDEENQQRGTDIKSLAQVLCMQNKQIDLKHYKISFAEVENFCVHLEVFSIRQKYNNPPEDLFTKRKSDKFQLVKNHSLY